LGANCCIMAIPALFARPMFRRLSAPSWPESFRIRDGLLAFAYILSPTFMLPFAIGTFVFIRSGRGFADDRDFRAGFAVGFFCVLTTAILNAVTLIVAGTEDWRLIAVLVLAAHIPIAIIEALIVGFTASFLRRVKPEMLGR
jgi:ABC-type Co2+ transport system permease subunit